jgi:hypothetical protein
VILEVYTSFLFIDEPPEILSTELILNNDTPILQSYSVIPVARLSEQVYQIYAKQRVIYGDIL